MKKTLITRFIRNAGLGNQIFEWAAGCAMAKKLGIDHECMWEPSTHREFGLGHFGITPLPFRDITPMAPMFGQGNAATAAAVAAAVKAHDGPECVIRSPFQAEECFAGAKDEIRAKFRLEPLPLDIPDGRTPVSMQVRRGDYLDHKALNVTTTTYFTDAMREIGRRVEKPHFFVVSDDPAWCERTFGRFSHVTVMPPQEPIDGLRTMVGCKAHIISNSTFGWWGAWLSGSDIVIAPEPWHHERANYGDWEPVPRRWTKVRSRQVEPFALQPPPELDRAIVYPWKADGATWEELRYSIRSVLRFFEDKECPIYILGNRRPGWLLLQSGRVRFLDRWSYREALETGVQLAKKVLWMNDDIVMLKPTSWDDAARPLHQGEVNDEFLAKMAHGDNLWRQGVLRVIRDLQTVGKVDRPKVFSTHTPYLYERDRAVEMFRTYGVWDKMPLEMAYGNTYWQDALPIGTEKTTEFPFGEARYLNHTDKLLTPEVKAALVEMFPDFAPWELRLPFKA